MKLTKRQHITQNTNTRTEACDVFIQKSLVVPPIPSNRQHKFVTLRPKEVQTVAAIWQNVM